MIGEHGRRALQARLGGEKCPNCCGVRISPCRRLPEVISMAQNPQLEVRAVGAGAEGVSGERRDYDTLMNLIGDSRLVLLGEASHRTHDFH